MTTPNLAASARQLMTKGKGILAADESVTSVDKRFGPYGIPNTEENRRQFRLLYLTAAGIENHLSGVILHEETVFQNTDEGQTFPSLLTGIGVLPGVKVDLGLEALPGFPGETVTKGLDTLKQRLQEFASLGLKFTKWRAAFPIDLDRGLPTDQALLANIHVLVRYALACQEAGLVPIVEPEVLLDGAHSISQSEATLSRVLRLLFEHLHYYKVDLSGLILKTSMVIAGSDAGTPSTAAEVGSTTLSTLGNSVPASVAGVVFLSGGQTPQQARDNLEAMVKSDVAKVVPWPFTFSYARALQEPALAVWQGSSANFAAGQAKFLETLADNTRIWRE